MLSVDCARCASTALATAAGLSGNLCCLRSRKAAGDIADVILKQFSLGTCAGYESVSIVKFEIFTATGGITLFLFN